MRTTLTLYPSALEHYRGAERDCSQAQELNARANTNADTADAVHENIVNSVKKLQELVTRLRELVTKEDGISEKVKKINRKITAIQGNERNSSVLYEEANAKFDVLDEEYQAEKAKDTFEVGQDFTRKVEGLRETQNAAFRLQDNVKALMEEVNAYKKEWEDLQARHRQIKAQVDDKKVSHSIESILPTTNSSEYAERYQKQSERGAKPNTPKIVQD